MDGGRGQNFDFSWTQETEVLEPKVHVCAQVSTFVLNLEVRESEKFSEVSPLCQVLAV